MSCSSAWSMGSATTGSWKSLQPRYGSANARRDSITPTNDLAKRTGALPWCFSCSHEKIHCHCFPGGQCLRHCLAHLAAAMFCDVHLFPCASKRDTCEGMPLGLSVQVGVAVTCLPPRGIGQPSLEEKSFLSKYWLFTLCEDFPRQSVETVKQEWRRRAFSAHSCLL